MLNIAKAFFGHYLAWREQWCPDDYTLDAEEKKQRLITLDLSVLQMTVFPFFLVTHAFMGDWPGVAVLACAIISFASGAWALRRGAPSLRVARQALLTFMLLSSYFSFVQGGLASPSLTPMIIVAPVALIIAGERESLMWLASTMAVQALEFALHQYGFAFPMTIPDAWMPFDRFTQLVASGVVALALLIVLDRARRSALADLAAERHKTEMLLLNILPESIARRLQKEATVIADSRSDVAVLFADIVGFTEMCRSIPATEVVVFLDEIFSRVDDVCARWGVTKIKTIGDCIMVASGVPDAVDRRAERLLAFAFEMRSVIAEVATHTTRPVQVRVGIHSGEVVAGVIGRRTLAYDLWGDTVNIASRLESNGVPGYIHVSDAFIKELSNPGAYKLSNPMQTPMKGVGEMTTYFIEEEKNTSALS